MYAEMYACVTGCMIWHACTEWWNVHVLVQHAEMYMYIIGCMMWHACIKWWNVHMHEPQDARSDTNVYCMSKCIYVSLEWLGSWSDTNAVHAVCATCPMCLAQKWSAVTRRWSMAPLH